MAPLAPTRRGYKETTLQQLRSFCETARLGSFTAAAASLGLAQPTVWKQVHALERDFGEKLVEPYGRGCRLTEAGQVLAQLVAPAVISLGTAKRRFREARNQETPQLVVVTTPRILVEDLPSCVVEFRQRYPDVRLTLKELTEEEVHAQVETGEADLGVIANRSRDLVNPWVLSPWLAFEPLYELDIVLVTPTDHPLARRRHVRPRDLRSYPLVNSLKGMPDAATIALLEQTDLPEIQPHLVEAFFFASVVRYVKLGFGIGLIGALPGRPPDPSVHERVMSQHFGRSWVYQLTRKGAPSLQVAVAFTQIVKEHLHQPQARSRPSCR